MSRVMQHPVPPKLLVHIGDITVSFALLEQAIQGLVGSLIREHQRIGQIITAELSFKNLRALAISLYLERHGEDSDANTLRDLMNRATQTEGERNQISHSVWGSGNTADTITRIKTTAKERHGIQFHFQDLGESDLANIALRMRTLAADIQAFKFHLLESGKCINSPMQKLW